MLNPNLLGGARLYGTWGLVGLVHAPPVFMGQLVADGSHVFAGGPH